MKKYTTDTLFNSHSREDVMNCIKAGININATNEYGKNALFFCNNVDAVKAMIEAGIDVNHTDNYGSNALFWNPNELVLECLIHSGINVHHKNKIGRSCLHQQRDIESAEILVNAGADIHCVDNKGRSVLSNLYFPDIFNYWIEKGCNINHRDYNGESVFDLSSDYGVWGYYFSVKILMQHIDKFERRTLHVDFCNTNSVLFLYELSEYGFKIELNKDHFVINSYISDYRDILGTLYCISDIQDVNLYNYDGGPLYKDIDKRIVKWMIINKFFIDLTKISDDKNFDEILKYKTSHEQKEISRHLKPAKNKITTAKNDRRL